MAVNLFDPSFYRAFNPDLGGLNDAQAFQHLLDFGLNEGRVFSQYADLNLYRTNNPDLAAAGLTTNRQLYDHLSVSGAAEGRAFSFVFNANFYRAANPDLGAAGLSNEQLFEHFRGFGVNEGRQASESFSANFYLAANPDLQAAGFDFQQALQHYVFSGIAEGRTAAPGAAPAPPGPPPPAPPPAGDPGNTPGAALNFGVISGTFNFEDFVGFDDREDYYRFEVATPINFDLYLDGLAARADVTLYEDINRNGAIESQEFVRNTRGSSGSTASISRNLSPGTYFVLVESSEGRNTSYTIQMVNQTSETIDVGALSSSRTFSDFVGQSDRLDFYRFSLNAPSSFNLTLNGLAADATVRVFEDLNNNGIIDVINDGFPASNERLASSSGSGTNSRSIERNLPLGNYFVVVETLGRNTNYTLEMSAGPAASPRNLGAINLNSTAAADFDSLTGTIAASELADLNNASLNIASASLIQDFSASNTVDSGSLASNSFSASLRDPLVAESLAGETNFTEAFAGNGLDLA